MNLRFVNLAFALDNSLHFSFCRLIVDSAWSEPEQCFWILQRSSTYCSHFVKLIAPSHSTQFSAMRMWTCVGKQEWSPISLQFGIIHFGEGCQKQMFSRAFPVQREFLWFSLDACLLITHESKRKGNGIWYASTRAPNGNERTSNSRQSVFGRCAVSFPQSVTQFARFHMAQNSWINSNPKYEIL